MQTQINIMSGQTMPLTNTSRRIKVVKVDKTVAAIRAMTPEARAAAINAYFEYAVGKTPSGKSDGGGRWYPSDSERCDCCSHMRQPSRAWPMSLYKHCLSRGHIEKRNGARHDDVLIIGRFVKMHMIESDNIKVAIEEAVS